MFCNKRTVFGFFNVACLIHLGLTQAYRNKPSPTPYHDWDYLMFSQRWPLTTCAEWEQVKQGNTCNLPSEHDIWTIHGIWPTKTGEKGPLFCPSAIHFNPEELTPMLSDLNNYWINVEANTKPNSFWAHEWNKHGTCASVLPQLDSVTNYFRMGLKLNKQYDLAKILAKGGITPGSDGYDVGHIYNVIKNAINKEPNIQCVIDEKTHESYISEIRICFNKSLELIDCDPSNPIHRMRYGLNTNCSQKKPVWYIANIPNEDDTDDEDRASEGEDTQYQEHSEKFQRYNLLFNFLRTLFWATL